MEDDPDEHWAAQVIFGKGHKLRLFLAARNTPGGKEVDDDKMASFIREIEGQSRNCDPCNSGSRMSDQWTVGVVCSRWRATERHDAEGNQSDADAEGDPSDWVTSLRTSLL